MAAQQGYANDDGSAETVIIQLATRYEADDDQQISDQEFV